MRRTRRGEIYWWWWVRHGYWYSQCRFVDAREIVRELSWMTLVSLAVLLVSLGCLIVAFGFL